MKRAQQLDKLLNQEEVTVKVSDMPNDQVQKQQETEMA